MVPYGSILSTLDIFGMCQNKKYGKDLCYPGWKNLVLKLSFHPFNFVGSKSNLGVWRVV